MSQSMYLALGYRCNHHCYFCPCGKERGTPVAETASIMEQLEYGIQHRNVEHVTLSGGEPTIHPDFSKILKRCIELGANVTVLTNGDCLHDKTFAQRCFGSVDPSRVSVVSAIHSIHEDVHDHVTGIRGSHTRTIQGLKNLIELRIPFTVKQCVSAWNYLELPEFADFVFREFGVYASMTICGMDFCGMNDEEIRNVAVGYREMSKSLEKMLDEVICLREKFGAFPLITVADLPLCSVDPYYWQFYVKVSRGKLTQYSAPTKESDNVRSVFNVENDCDTYFQACSECAAREWCPGVWRTAYTYFGEKEATCIRG